MARFIFYSVNYAKNISSFQKLPGCLIDLLMMTACLVLLINQIDHPDCVNKIFSQPNCDIKNSIRSMARQFKLMVIEFGTVITITWRRSRNCEIKSNTLFNPITAVALVLGQTIWFSLEYVEKNCFVSQCQIRASPGLNEAFN